MNGESAVPLAVFGRQSRRMSACGEEEADENTVSYTVTSIYRAMMQDVQDESRCMSNVKTINRRGVCGPGIAHRIASHRQAHSCRRSASELYEGVRK